MWKAEEAFRPLGAVFRGVCEPPDMRAGNCTQDFTEPHFQSQCGSHLEATFQLALLVLCIFYYGEYKGEKGVNCLGYLPIPEVNIEVIMELFVR